jgi:hypothetical protein
MSPILPSEGVECPLNTTEAIRDLSSLIGEVIRRMGVSYGPDWQHDFTRAVKIMERATREVAIVNKPHAASVGLRLSPAISADEFSRHTLPRGTIIRVAGVALRLADTTQVIVHRENWKAVRDCFASIGAPLPDESEPRTG